MPSGFNPRAAAVLETACRAAVPKITPRFQALKRPLLWNMYVAFWRFPIPASWCLACFVHVRGSRTELYDLL